MPPSPSLFLVTYDDLDPGLDWSHFTIFDEGAIIPTRRPRAQRRSLLIQSDSAFVVIDPGVGLFDRLAPRRRLSFRTPRSGRPGPRVLRRQLEDRGIDADRVEHIVLTHTRADNIGAISDFPAARIHLLPSDRLELLDAKLARAVPQLAHQPVLVTPSPATSVWQGRRCHRLRIAGLTLDLVEFSTQARDLRGVLVHLDSGSVLHLGEVVPRLDDLMSPTAAFDALSALRLLCGPHPFERLTIFEQLRQLVQHPSDTLTLTATRGATSRLSVGRGPYPTIGFL